ncbi:huntingtin isoform X2 [Cephus cinctus]|uniref:Huntingtin isoform X2 n=1 Tax=Cephus cinctus TaxID=211228 RepID=A0AAJ7W2L2_CEPCN|nr:huntingtin isoform X2 [Cephus cinctus]
MPEQNYTDGNIIKVQVKLYYEIKRNGSARSLRAALWRFAQLSEVIRPVKGKAYVSNLIPCIVAIAQRKEESVIETLANTLPLILKTLGAFTTDNDIKTLLKAFFHNISSPEPVFRRTAASMILTTCLNSRKPEAFLCYVLNFLIDRVVPVADDKENLTTVMGVFGCLRIVLPHMNEMTTGIEVDNSQKVDSLIQIYELCLHYAKWHADHNVINAALETLAQLLQSPSKEFASILLSKDGITRSRIWLNESAARLSLGQMSFSTTTVSGENSDSALNLFESEIPEIEPKIEKWIAESESALPVIQRPQIRQAVPSEIIEMRGKTLENYSNLTIGSIDSDGVEEGSDVGSEIEKSETVPESVSLMTQPSKDEDSSDERGLSIASPHKSLLNIPFAEIDIGNFTNADIPLKYCCRYLASSFLLTGSVGQLIPDRMFRVSVKSLALTCIGHILRLYPRLLLSTVAKEQKYDESPQFMSDILLFADHPDPQIRGHVMMLIGCFLKAVFVQFGGRYSDVISGDLTVSDKKEYCRTLPLDNLVKLILKGIEDESATTCRQTLMALGICLVDLLESVDNKCGIPILTILPRLVKNPYFLVKVKLAEVLAILPYSTIEHITGGSQFQENVIKVLIKLLSDQDQRVRHVTSNSIVKIIPMLYYRNPNEDAITRKASQYTEEYLSSSVLNPLETSNYEIGDNRLLVNSLVEPFNFLYTQNNIQFNERIDNALSQIVSVLTETVIMDFSKYLTYGCCEALTRLSESYFTTIYPKAWDCLVPKPPAKKTYRRSNSRGDVNDNSLLNDIVLPICNGLMPFTISLLSSSQISLDLSTHRHLILLAGNLASGMAFCNLKPSEPIHKNDTDTVKLWGLFKDKQMYQYLELLLIHVARVLNVFVHVIDEIQLTQPSTKSSLPSLPTPQSLSPKRKTAAEAKPKEKEERKTTLKFGKEQMGAFSNIPHYMKLYDILKAANANYKVTLDSEASEMYISLLNATLEVLSQILEIASIHETGRIAEEILHYLQTTVVLCPTSTVRCVQQLLKCLFGANLSAQWSEFDIQRNLDRTSVSRDDAKGFYNQCFQRPARQMAEAIKAIGNNCRGGNEPDTGWIGLLRRKGERKMSTVSKSLTRSMDQKVSVASFIRLFEPMVIKSLKQYTVTSSVSLQCQVLMLVSQLVQLHVNYCLLDSDMIFKDFIIKQFEFIEEGQIPHTEDLLPKIFNFLVHLSYNKYHTKIIIGVPEIIQLCDRLMASGQPPLTHCIPALTPVVEDIFLARNARSSSSEQKELETTREVLVSMLLKLVEHHQVIELLAVCLTESRFSGDGNGEEKWRRWSRLTTDTVLPMLADGKIRIETKDAHAALVKLFAAVSPTVFRPVDPLLKVLFSVPPNADEPIIKLQRWLGMINVVLLTLISYAKEEVMLARLSDCSTYMTDMARLLMLPDSVYQSTEIMVDPLNVLNAQSFNVPPERILARFIFRVIELIGARVYKLLGLINNKVENSLANSTESLTCDDYLIHQFALFLQLCIHMFESGSHCKVANATMQMIQGRNIPDDEILPLMDLNTFMLEIANKCPLLTCQWAYLMTLLGYNEMIFWSKVLGIHSSSYVVRYSPSTMKPNPSDDNSSINIDIVRKGGTILFCDYVCENLSDAEPLTWLLVNHIEETINLATESPVRELVAAAVHRNPAASGLLVQAIAAKCLDLSKPSFVKKLLLCVEGAHNSQSGPLILALVPRLLASKHLALSRMAAKIASRKAETLLTLSMDEANEQLPKEDLIKTMDILQSTKLAKKHSSLVILLNKLGAKHYDLSPLELEQCRPFNPSTIRSIKLDKNWFFTQTKYRCCHPSINYGSYESAQLLSNLDFDDIIDIITCREFSVKILKECIKLGVRKTLETCQDLELGQDVKEESFEFKENPLYTAAKQCLLQHVQYIVEMMPKPHHAYNPLNRDSSGKEGKHAKNSYMSRFTELLTDSEYWDFLFMIVPSVITYMRTLSKLSKFNLCEIDVKYEEHLAKFALLCFDVSHWIIHNHENDNKKMKPHELHLTMNCAEEILRQPCLTKVFGSSTHYSWVCSAAATLTRIVEHLLTIINPLPVINTSGLQAALDSDETRPYAEACKQMATLVAWLEECQMENSPENIPPFLFNCIKNLIISISRQPLVNSFVLTPPLAWKQGWRPSTSSATKCRVPLLSSESNFLQEIDILEQFIYRVTLLGWTSRLQFEEMWMAFLSVLNVAPNKNMPQEEIANLSRATSLAVQAITRLLMQTLLLPHPGNPGTSTPIHHSRDPQLSLYKISSRKLFIIQDTLLWKYECMNDSRNVHGLKLEHIFSRGNIERVGNSHAFTYSQLSVPYLWASCYLHEDKLSSSVLTLKNRRNDALMSMSLDLNSCLRFLIELYSSWILPQSNTPLRLLNEVIKSILSISELFVERGQYQWMLDTCLEISRTHPVENEILHQYIVIAACKAAAVLTPLDVETLEKVKRLVDINLKSDFLPAGVSALHGTLYLLQSAVLADCEETMNMIHPLAIEYIQKHIDTQDSNGVLSQSEEHQGIMWALVFFLLEHADDTPPDSEAPAVLELVLSLVTTKNISIALHQTLLHGLERLVTTKSVVGKVTEQIVKVAIDRLRQANPMLALPALQLLLTCMYTEAADRLNQPDVEEPLPDAEPEALIRSIERTSGIFDRIKRGYPMEVEILCAVLSGVLGDFFPPSEILTRVIGEFLSPQQPHPRLLSAVVFQVCQRACNGPQLGLLQDWVLFSLPNFIQSLPVAMSTWCLSCFFISASTNQWLRALFPHVQSRIGKYEYEDKKILCIAAADFYHQLSNESQRKAFVETFETAAKRPDTPFSYILASF